MKFLISALEMHEMEYFPHIYYMDIGQAPCKLFINNRQVELYWLSLKSGVVLTQDSEIMKFY